MGAGHIANMPDEAGGKVASHGVLAWLRTHCREGERCVALIDPTRYDGVEACAVALGFTVDAFAGLPNLYGHFTDQVRQWGPRLFSAPLDDAHWPMIAAQASSHQAASFILTAADDGALYAHLKSLAKLPQPDGTRLLFRFQDTVVLTALMPLLAPAQRQALLGRATCWMALDVCGDPRVVERGRSHPARPAVLTLTAAQMATLDAALLPGTIIAQANDTDSTLLAGMTKCAQWRTIRERITQAHDHGLSQAEDIALYCVLSLQLPVGFDRDGPVAGALEAARNSSISFGGAIDRVPLSQWREWDEVLDAPATPEQ